MSRGKKLGVDVINNTKNKLNSLTNYCKDIRCTLDEVLYVGNDINDYEVMTHCGLKFCPSDSHPTIKNIAETLNVKGGDGVVREILENHFNLNMVEIYNT